MPRLSKRLPAYSKHKASGQAVVTIDGRDHYLGVYNSRPSRREYDRLVQEWLARGRVPEPEVAGVTVAEVLARYWRHARAYYAGKDGKETGETGAVRVALRHVRELYGPSPAASFGPLALKAVRQRMVDAGMARTTINALVNRIRRMFRWAAGRSWWAPRSGPRLKTVEALRRGKTTAREPDPVTPIDDATVEATLPHLPEVVADMVRLQRLTGARPSEVCALRPCDVDRSGDCWVYRPADHKTAHRGRGRVIVLGPQSQAVLLRYLARGAEDHCFRPCDSEAKRRSARSAERKTPLSCGNKPGGKRAAKPRRPAGQRYDTNAYGRAIHRACDKAKVPRWSPNRLRHAAATAIRKAYGIEAAQVCLGHSAPDTTSIYAEVDLARAVEVARAIG